MATAYQIKEISTPKIIVDDAVVPIVPNSGLFRIPGDYKVRAMSVGDGTTQIVSGLNAESLVGHVKFELAATNENVDRIKKWKANALAGVGSTINIVTPDGQYPHSNMFLTKDTDVHMKADGNLSCDFEGQYNP